MMGTPLFDQIPAALKDDIEAWKASFEGQSPRHRAIVQNLEEETRIPQDKAEAFFRKLTEKISGDPLNEGIVAKCVEECAAEGNCLDKLIPADAAEMKEPGVTFALWWAVLIVRRYNYVALGTHSSKPKKPPKERPLISPYRSDGKPVWCAFRQEIGDGESPDGVRDRMGLSYNQPDWLYFLEVPLSADDVFVPTAFDSGARPEWRPPSDQTKAFGRTRNLKTGEEEVPEILRSSPIENAVCRRWGNEPLQENADVDGFLEKRFPATP